MKRLIAGVSTFALPVLAFAQTSDPSLRNLGVLLDNIGVLIGRALPILVALALLFFFYGLAKFILASGGDEEARKGGKHIMVWGIVALFVMVSVWGLVSFVGNALGIRQGEGIGVTPSVGNIGR